MDFMKKRHQLWNPLEKRTYRYKKSAMEFFCPLCRTQRNFSISFRLSPMNYIQMLIITTLFTVATFSVWELRGAIVFFILWPIFELVRRALFKREIPCPHCGFDASWYKKDVKVARKLVSDFWRGTTSPASSEVDQGGDTFHQAPRKDQNISESSAQF